MGAYCQFCGLRCFVVRVLVDGRSMALATCQRGAEFDMSKLGQDYRTAVNPAAADEQSVLETVQRLLGCTESAGSLGYLLGEHWVAALVGARRRLPGEPVEVQIRLAPHAAAQLADHADAVVRLGDIVDRMRVAGDQVGELEQVLHAMAPHRFCLPDGCLDQVEAARLADRDGDG